MSSRNGLVLSSEGRVILTVSEIVDAVSAFLTAGSSWQNRELLARIPRSNWGGAGEKSPQSGVR